MDRDMDMAGLGRRVREVRELAKVSQGDAAAAIGVSQPTYSRIETGDRPLKGYELVQLADRFGVRAGAISGLAPVASRARYVARTDGSATSMNSMRDRLYSYLELDAFLTDQGIAGV